MVSLIDRGHTFPTNSIQNRSDSIAEGGSRGDQVPVMRGCLPTSQAAFLICDRAHKVLNRIMRAASPVARHVLEDCHWILMSKQAKNKKTTAILQDTIQQKGDMPPWVIKRLHYMNASDKAPLFTKAVDGGAHLMVEALLLDQSVHQTNRFKQAEHAMQKAVEKKDDKVADVVLRLCETGLAKRLIEENVGSLIFEDYQGSAPCDYVRGGRQLGMKETFKRGEQGKHKVTFLLQLAVKKNLISLKLEKIVQKAFNQLKNRTEFIDFFEAYSGKMINPVDIWFARLCSVVCLNQDDDIRTLLSNQPKDPQGNVPNNFTERLNREWIECLNHIGDRSETTVQAFLDYGMDINAPIYGGENVLHRLVWECKLAISLAIKPVHEIKEEFKKKAEFLVERGADLRKSDNGYVSYTPVQLARLNLETRFLDDVLTAHHV